MTPRGTQEQVHTWWDHITSQLTAPETTACHSWKLFKSIQAGRVLCSEPSHSSAVQQQDKAQVLRNMEPLTPRRRRWNQSCGSPLPSSGTMKVEFVRCKLRSNAVKKAEDKATGPGGPGA